MKSTDHEFAVTAEFYQKAERCLIELETDLREVLKRIKATNENQAIVAKSEYRVWDRVEAILKESRTSRSGV